MNLATIKRGGMLAGKKRYLLLAAVLVGPVISYLTGDLDLQGLLVATLQALAGSALN
ncbi:hypothetical protein J2847_004139 [Azospirillum agricola]|uniref:hypothetical protein n=1 Tax=Azospirillum agricola TaxID=1720247 RepID=UPI001AE4DF99|nr:hypothetical protein [Azospirillum agricola]MBP2230830.1 hypothetical protein [Azospirillum agricola]